MGKPFLQRSSLEQILIFVVSLGCAGLIVTFLFGPLFYVLSFMGK